jgi:hypothetical protein
MGFVGMNTVTVEVMLNVGKVAGGLNETGEIAVLYVFRWPRIRRSDWVPSQSKIDSRES